MTLKERAKLTDEERENVEHPDTHYMVAVEISDSEARRFFRQLPWCFYILTPKFVFIRS